MQSVHRDMHFEVYVCVCCVSWIIWTSGMQVDGITLAPIYWNSSNPIFKISNNGHVIEVNLYDEIDFVCPYFSMMSNSSSSYEYYIIYQVSKQAFEDCDLYADNGAVMIVNCSNPNQRKRFTMLIETFQAIPKVPEFNAGQTYYYISTSSGSKDGLLDVDGGACLHHNMKMLVRVCCDTMAKSTKSLSHTVSSTMANQIGRLSFQFSSSAYPEIKPRPHWTSLKGGDQLDKTTTEQKTPKASTLEENNIYLAHKGLSSNVHLMLPLPIVVLSGQLFALTVLHIALSKR